MNKLYLGDNIEIMKEYIPNNSVDLAVTSPPYDNLRTYENSLEWNFKIFAKIAKELYRVTKNGGVIVWVVCDATINGSETGTSFRQALYFKKIGFKLHDTMIYGREKIPQEKNRYENGFEYMFILSKGKPNTFNPIMVGCANAHSKVKHRSIRNSDGTTCKIKNEYVNKYKKPTNVFNYGVGYMKSSKDTIAFNHPAIFPEQLASDHIISWSNENDLVFDPFMGSGTTGKMAILNNRNFIGIEKVKNYFDISQERINKAMQEKESMLTWT
jgi:DNA modification methylase